MKDPQASVLILLVRMMMRLIDMEGGECVNIGSGGSLSLPPSLGFVWLVIGLDGEALVWFGWMEK